MSDEKRTEATPAQADAASDAKAIKGKTDAQAALDKTARLDNTQELPPLRLLGIESCYRGGSNPSFGIAPKHRPRLRNLPCPPPRP